jgi:hypothetical protein
MIESIVAISVVLVGLLGIVSLLIRSIGINRDVASRLVATHLAAEGIEIVRSLVDKNAADIGRGVPGVVWNTGISPNALVDYDSDGFSDCAGTALFISGGMYNCNEVGTEMGFSRTVSVVDEVSSSDRVIVMSRVDWTDRSGDHVVTIRDIFYDWRRTN